MYVIRVNAYFDWDSTFICPCATSEDALNYAYECAKKKFSCYLPKTYKELEDEERGYLEILSEDAELIYWK